MSDNRPNRRLAQTALRQQLGPALEYVEHPEMDGFLAPGESFQVNLAGDRYRLELRVVRLIDGAPAKAGAGETVQQPPLPFKPPIPPVAVTPRDVALPMKQASDSDSDGTDEGERLEELPIRPLKEAHFRILAKVTNEIQTGRKIVQAAGYKYNSSTRMMLADLYRHHKVDRPRKNCYRLPAEAQAS